MNAFLLSTLLCSLPTAGASPAASGEDPALSAGTLVLQKHYERVIAELESRPVPGLTGAQRSERERSIDLLREYAARGRFGVNDQPGARVPLFQDSAGTRCAVAELMHSSGEQEFVGRIAATNNDAWICELECEPEFLRWLDRCGLDVAEAARIHGPSNPRPGGGGGSSNPGAGGGGAGGGTGGGGGSGPIPTGGRGPGSGYSGPGDINPGPSTGAPGTPAPAAGPATGRPGPPVASGPMTGPGGAAGTGRGAGPSTLSLTTADDDGWWLWWEYNKLEFLRPNRLDWSHQPMTGDDPAELLRHAADEARGETVPLFEAALSSPDGLVRAAAVVALGRSGDERAVERLLGCLSDPNAEVRARAILALGATGSFEAARHLRQIARTGAVEGERERIVPNARGLAIVGIGLLREQGFEPSIDLEIARLVRDRSSQSDHEQLAVAAMVCQSLQPSEALSALAFELASDDKESALVRCRATEALRGCTGSAVLAKLQDLLHGSRMDLRRSAALALGTLDHELALPSLQTAYEVEAEPLTRGFVLTSIGRRGSPAARTFLENVLAKGESGQRRWAALGLGLWARAAHDGSVATAIRAAREREKNRAVLGAYWLALGLCGDSGSVPAIAEAMGSAGDPRERTYAATALALVGGDSARQALLARLPLESQGMVRGSIAASLGVIGVPEDAEAILAGVASVKDAGLQGLVSAAVAFHGSPEALHALLGIAKAPGTSSARRAAVLEGLGMMLARATPLRLNDVSRQANYMVFSDWMGGMFDTTL